MIRHIKQESLTALGAAYPARPVGVRHALQDHALFTLDALADLAGSLPDDHVEHSLGNLAVDQNPDAIARAALSPAQIVRTIADNGCWMVLKKVDRDPAYAALIAECLAEIAPAVVPHTGACQRPEAFIFLSSPHAVTPFHMDPEHNILLQIAGTKTMRIYPADDPRIVSQQQHEAFHRGGVHRNMPFDAAFDDSAAEFVLTPGEAVYVPVKAPHWVQNGAEASISFSITWRSRLSDAEARVHRFNSGMRRLRLDPAAPGAYPMSDQAKVMAHRTAKSITGAARRVLGRERDRTAY